MLRFDHYLALATWVAPGSACVGQFGVLGARSGAASGDGGGLLRDGAGVQGQEWDFGELGGSGSGWW